LVVVSFGAITYCIGGLYSFNFFFLFFFLLRNQCFQDVRLIATNRPGRLELLDQGLRLGQTVQEIGRPISRRPVAINRLSRLCGRPAREWAASQSWAYLDTRGDGGGFRVDADLLE